MNCVWAVTCDNFMSKKPVQRKAPPPPPMKLFNSTCWGKKTTMQTIERKKGKTICDTSISPKRVSWLPTKKRTTTVNCVPLRENTGTPRSISCVPIQKSQRVNYSVLKKHLRVNTKRCFIHRTCVNIDCFDQKLKEVWQ